MPDALANVAPLEIGFAVADLERSIGFYRDGLGLDLVSRIDTPVEKARQSGISDDPYTVVRLQMRGGERIKLFRSDAPRQARPGVERPLDTIGFAFVTLIVDDIAAALAKLERIGRKPRGDGFCELRPGVLVALVDDPDNNVIELVEYSDLASYRPDLKP